MTVTRGIPRDQSLTAISPVGFVVIVAKECRHGVGGHSADMQDFDIPLHTARLPEIDPAHFVELLFFAGHLNSDRFLDQERPLSFSRIWRGIVRMYDGMCLTLGYTQTMFQDTLAPIRVDWDSHAVTPPLSHDGHPSDVA